ncbi:MAG: flagellar export protein FliJ [Opitutae bacterium]|nr:flagellar export protein FliJ [Opitutae bacterium]
MRAFHFRLQTLLNLREMAREEALSTYASAIRQRELNEEKLADCNNTLDELRKAVATRRTNRFTGAEQANFQQAVNLAKERLLLQRNKVNRAKQVEENTRMSYVKADGDEKSLINLKARREEDHFHFELKKEERELEDVIGARYTLKPTT